MRDTTVHSVSVCAGYSACAHTGPRAVILKFCGGDEVLAGKIHSFQELKNFVKRFRGSRDPKVKDKDFVNNAATFSNLNHRQLLEDFDAFHLKYPNFEHELRDLKRDGNLIAPPKDNIIGDNLDAWYGHNAVYCKCRTIYESVTQPADATKRE